MVIENNYKGFEIHYEYTKNKSRDVKSVHIFKAFKPLFQAISIALFEVDSTKSDITNEEIIEIGIKKIKKMIDRNINFFEENL